MASKYKALAAKKFIETFESKVCGIPCIVGVSYYQSVKGSYNYHAASDWDYYGGTECEWELLDRNYRPASWLHDKAQNEDQIGVVDDIVVDHMESLKDYY